MNWIKQVWGKIPAGWKDRLYGAAGMGVMAYAGPQAKELWDVVWPCVRAHYGL